MNRATMILVTLAAVIIAVLLLEWFGVIVALIALIGLVALVVIVLAIIVITVLILLSIPYYFLSTRMEVKEGSFTLDRLEDKKQ